MKLIIDISKEDLRIICERTEKEINEEYFGVDKRLIEAVQNGTPLPKEHGRLIDADVFEKRLMDARSYYIGEKADDFDLRFASGLKSAAERLVDAPTIIEADKCDNDHDCEHCDWVECPEMKGVTE